METDSATRDQRKIHVFLSYRFVEAKLADLLQERLDRDFIGLVKLFVATDSTSIPAGSRWLSEMVDALRKAKLHVVLCSPESVDRPWINYEAGAARVLDIPIIPMCHSGLTPEQLPVPLSDSEGVLLADAHGLRKLYRAVADLIGSDVPAIDFERLAAEFTALEKTLAPPAISATSDPSAEPELLTNPSVLCVSSPQFQQLGIANQLQLVVDAFPKSIPHERVLSGNELRRIALSQHIDIVHIAAFVCPRAGDLYFSDVSLPDGDSRVEKPDIITPDAMRGLLEAAKTRLVVLGGTASIALAAELVAVTNVIAARDVISAPAMASWVSTFYEALRRVPLGKACELATSFSRADMKLYPRLCTSSDAAQMRVA